MIHRHSRKLIAAAGVVGLVLTMSAAAIAQGVDDPDAPRSGPDAAPDMTPLVARDLDITQARARALLDAEPKANQVEQTLRRALAGSYGGTWISDEPGEAGSVVVATTDRSEVSRIRNAGAQAVLVDRSEEALDKAKAELDDAARPSHRAVAGWYVSPSDNQVVVQVLPGGEAAAEAFVKASGIDTSAVRTVPTDERPELFYNVRGGAAYYPGNARCSIGFSVRGGFVTAGHCGDRGTRTRGFNNEPQGTVQGSRFPGNDMGWVRVNDNWTPRPWVNRQNGTNMVVQGARSAVVGAAVCRSGSTTGWHCGRIRAKNQTVNYAEGQVNGLTRTTVCAEPGDSGGSYITPRTRQAQGVTSGGSGNCSSGGVTFFQPVRPILNRWNLTLRTG